MRVKRIIATVATSFALMFLFTPPAFAVRGCDTPTDSSCCSFIETLKGCRN